MVKTPSRKAKGTSAERTADAGQATHISRGEGVSVWRQIAEDIAGKIMGGELGEGQRLPTESDLADTYGVNRHTLRRAIADLSRRGLVEAAPRRGTFVTNARIEYPIRLQTRFSEIIRAAGRQPGGRLLACRITTPPPEMAHKLAIAEKAKVVEAEYLRFANAVPICWATSWFPADRFQRLPQLLSNGATVTEALAHVGVKDYVRKQTLISARAATTKERKILEIERGAAVLVAEAVNADRDGEPIQAGRSIFSAAIVQLLVET